MRLHLLFVGKTSFQEINQGINRYLDRLQHYALTELHVIRAEKVTSKISESMVKERESERIYRLIGKQDYLVVWDRRGKQLDSEGFAQFLDQIRGKGVSNVWMAIGGPLGIAPGLIDQASAVLSISKMTLPHDLARLVIVEQLYRAFTILKGEPYHK